MLSTANRSTVPLPLVEYPDASGNLPKHERLLVNEGEPVCLAIAQRIERHILLPWGKRKHFFAVATVKEAQELLKVDPKALRQEASYLFMRLDFDTPSKDCPAKGIFSEPSGVAVIPMSATELKDFAEKAARRLAHNDAGFIVSDGERYRMTVSDKEKGTKGFWFHIHPGNGCAGAGVSQPFNRSSLAKLVGILFTHVEY